MLWVEKMTVAPLVAQGEYLLFQHVGVDGVESAERFVEDEQLGFVQDGDDELELLRHALAQFAHFLVPPVFYAEFLEPHLQPGGRFSAGETFELCEIDGLFAHLHLFVESAFLRQIAYLVDVLRSEFAAVEVHLAAVGGGDAVDYPDKRGLSRSVRAEQAIDRAARYLKRYVVEGRMVGKTFCNVFNSQYSHLITVLGFG